MAKKEKVAAEKEKIQTPEFRASFPALFEPRAAKQGDKPMYSITMLFRVTETKESKERGEKVVEAWEKLLPEGALFEHKLLSPAKLEKLPGVGKGKIDHLTFKPEAKKAIARDTDPRPKAASKAQDDFGVVEAYPKGPGVAPENAGPAAVEFDLDAELLGTGPKRDPLWPL